VDLVLTAYIDPAQQRNKGFHSYLPGNLMMLYKNVPQVPVIQVRYFDQTCGTMRYICQ
jgi:hypothetical protein